jgi:crotonobetainyl-CoA:carnitine CoA-transferase CaiB-like acyl-CoA transferase
MPTRPLARFKVLDFSQAWAAPIASMMMGDLGADIAKIEPPEIGDHVRKWTRPDLHGMSPYFISANRNKRGMVIDLKIPEGQALALELADKADVLLENFRPRTMDRLGLGYDVVSARNPGIVYCSVSGYGAGGPYSQRAAYDLLIQGEGGLISVTGQEDGTLAKVGVPIIDAMSANIAAFTILAALLGREQSGKGQHLDVSMLEVASTTMSTLLVDYAISGRKAKPMGTGNQILAPYQAFPTATIPIVLGVLTEGHWKLFCDLIGRPDLLGDDRFRTAPVRIANREALNAVLFPILKQKSAKEWIEVMSGIGLACGFVNDVETLSTHVQHEARGFFQEFDEGGVKVRVPGMPWKVEPSAEAPTPPPHKGEHTREILQDWLGMSDASITRLIENGVIRTADA